MTSPRADPARDRKCLEINRALFGHEFADAILMLVELVVENGAPLDTTTKEELLRLIAEDHQRHAASFRSH